MAALLSLIAAARLTDIGFATILGAVLIVLQFAKWYTSRRALLSSNPNEVNPVMPS